MNSEKYIMHQTVSQYQAHADHYSQLVRTQSQPSVQTDNAILENNWLQHHAEQTIESRITSKQIYANNVDFI